MNRVPSQSEIDELRTAFILMDSDRDGRVTAVEIQSMLQQLGICLREDIVLNLVRQASQSGIWPAMFERELLVRHKKEPGSTLMNEAEFFQWVRRIQALRPTSPSQTDSDGCSADEEAGLDLVAAFRVFDRDKNGFITKDELRLAMELIDESMTDSGLNELIKMADVDKDGRINYEEFAKMLL